MMNPLSIFLKAEDFFFFVLPYIQDTEAMVCISCLHNSGLNICYELTFVQLYTTEQPGIRKPQHSRVTDIIHMNKQQFMKK